MFNAISLASGSNGNSVLVLTKNTKILLDAGIHFTDISHKLKYLKIEPKTINAIFLTHEHNDHSKGAVKLSRTYNITIYSNRPTLNRLESKFNLNNIRIERIKTNISIQIGDLLVNSFKIIHDSAMPAGYSVRCREHKISYLVDLSKFTYENKKEIQDSDLVIIDSNYDRVSLLDGKYPYPVKQRIMNSGHLSNETVGNIILNHPNRHNTEFWLAHLSEHNNRPELACTTINCILKKGGCNRKVDYKILPRKKIGPLWTAYKPKQMLLPVIT